MAQRPDECFESPGTAVTDVWRPWVGAGKWSQGSSHLSIKLIQICIWVCAWKRRCPQGTELLDPLETELQEVGSLPTWVLGTESGFLHWVLVLVQQAIISVSFCGTQKQWDSVIISVRNALNQRAHFDGIRARQLKWGLHGSRALEGAQLSEVSQRVHPLQVPVTKGRECGQHLGSPHSLLSSCLLLVTMNLDKEIERIKG